MSASLGSAVLELRADKGKLDADMQDAKRSVSKTLDSIGSSLQKYGRRMTTFVTLPLLALGKTAIDHASDTEESLNKVQVVFGDAADAIVDYSETSAEAMGMSQQQYLEAAGTLGNLFTAMQLGQQDAADMSANLVSLAADLASFNNLDPADVLTKLSAAMTGEAEPAKRLGMDLRATTVDAKAMEMGLADTTDQLTEADRMQARYALMIEQSHNALGDFAKTSDGLANSQRILKAEFENLLASLGQVLLPLAQKAVTLFQGWIAAFQALSPETKRIIVIVLGVVAALGPLLMIVGGIISAVGTILPVLGAIGGVLSGPLLLAIGAVVGAVALFRAAWVNDWGGIQEAFAALWEAIQPIFQELWSWIQYIIPIALEALSIYWNMVLLPAIQLVWGFVRDVVFPILAELFGWLAANLPAAIQALSSFWTNVLLPAISAVWSWMSGTLFPFLAALADFLGAVFGVAVTALAGLWQNVLQPALQIVGNYLGSTLQPVFEKFGNFMRGTVAPVVERVGRFLGGVFADALAKISDFIRDLTDKLHGFADSLRNIELPSWLTPGSPTPWEIGLRGIYDAMQDVVDKGLPRMEAQLRVLPEPASLSAGLDAGSASAQGMSVVQHYYFNDTTLDEGQLAATMRRMEALYA